MNELEEKYHLFLEYLAARNYSPETLQTRGGCLRKFLGFCRLKRVHKPGLISVELVEEYAATIHAIRRDDGRQISSARIRNYFISLNMFCRWLQESREILFNPMEKITLPAKEKSLPRSILTAREVVRFLTTPVTTKTIGLRDRAILETLYSTGIRALELSALDVSDLDFQKGTLFVHQGKGKKDRVVPIGKRALKWVESYLTYSRRKLHGENSNALFLDQYGQRLSQQSLRTIVREHKKKAGIEKPGVMHIFRHTMATHMLQNGADVRHVQAILGHESVETTQIYTHVSLRDLKQIYEKLEGRLYA